ncbi:MAG: DNA-processing protein DprA [Nitriliruptorales bacterium]
MTRGGAWARVAAPGTDPALLARVVARLAGPRGDPRTLAREATTHDLRLPLAPGVQDTLPTSTRRLLEVLAPTPTPTTASAAQEVARRWARLGVRAALVGDPAYSRRLAAGWPASGAPPLVAWRGGALGPPDAPSVAIVGARRASSYGTGIAAWLAAAAAGAGAVVVSGGAVGVDAAAHEAALAGRGATVVVLGCGHDVAYPRAHAHPGGLFERILSGGGWLLSELLPDAPATPPHVLARNRLVAGLADAVVVVEGGARSGALRTAAVAAEIGIPVLAVPGDVGRPGSMAPHRLLSEGAAPCTSPADLLTAVGLGEEPGEDRTSGSVLPPAVRSELVRLWPRAILVGKLAEKTRLHTGELLAALTRARLAGEVAEGVEGVRLTRAPR